MRCSGCSAPLTLSLSSIPFSRTIAAVRIGQVEGSFVVNPTFEQRATSELDLVVAGTSDGIVMVEAGAREVPEPTMVMALETAHVAIQAIVRGIDALRQDTGKAKVQVSRRDIGREFYREVEEQVLVPLAEAMRVSDKADDEGRADELLNELVASLPDGEIERRVEAKAIFKELKERVLREEILTRGTRLDGRA